ncbi:MAG: GNAT family N-acetyltransferase [Desulfuromonadaceae bacterium]
MIIQITPEQMHPVSLMAADFANHTGHVIVDPDHATKTYQRMIRSGAAVVFALMVGDKVVGGLGGIKGPDLHHPRIVAVETFWFVLPEFRGKGLRLFAAFENWAVEKKCDAVAMVHLTDSQPEILEKLYRRKGYELIEKHYLKVLK